MRLGERPPCVYTKGLRIAQVSRREAPDYAVRARALETSMPVDRMMIKVRQRAVADSFRENGILGGSRSAGSGRNAQSSRLTRSDIEP